MLLHEQLLLFYIISDANRVAHYSVNTHGRAPFTRATADAHMTHEASGPRIQVQQHVQPDLSATPGPMMEYAPCWLPTPPHANDGSLVSLNICMLGPGYSTDSTQQPTPRGIQTTPHGVAKGKRRQRG
jgi:hypothetical protein